MSAFNEIRKHDNDKLQFLLKEIKEIGSSELPQNMKQTPEMQQLFEIEKTNCYSWTDQFNNIQRAIEVEILWRVKTNDW